MSSPALPSHGRMRPLGLAQVSLTCGFWHERQTVNAAATLAHCESWTERLGWSTNFDRVADGTTGPDRPGRPFSDSEAAGICGHPEIEARLFLDRRRHGTLRGTLTLRVPAWAAGATLTDEYRTREVHPHPEGE